MIDRNRVRVALNPLGKRVDPGEQTKVRNYLLQIVVEGMRKHLCFGCSFSRLYDKNNKEYRINNRTATVDQVRTIVEEIRKVNAS